MIRAIIFAVFVCVMLLSAAAQESLLPNGSFEKLAGEWPAGWATMWSRDQGVGEAKLTDDAHTGQRAVLITHRGQQDWSLQVSDAIQVAPGEMLVMGAWAKAEGQGDASISVTTMDKDGKVLDWMWGERSLPKSATWQMTRTRIIIPDGCARIRPRVTGNGPITLTVDDLHLIREGNVKTMQINLPDRLTIANKLTEVTFLPREGAFLLRDLRTGQEWRIESRADAPLASAASKTENGLQAQLLDVSSGLQMKLEGSLSADRPEFTLILTGDGELPQPVRFPGPVKTQPGEWLVIPMNEGIMYPVDDKTVTPPNRLIGYGGHGISMSWYGVTDMKRGIMAILETPDDASIRMERGQSGLLSVRPEWESSKGQFAYPRKLTFALFDSGGYVAQAKRYREYAKQIGKYRSLREKAQFNPNVEKLYGAVNVWPMGGLDIAALGREFKQLGMDRALFNTRSAIDELNALGFLVGRYDIYQDLQPPDVAEKYGLGHGDWTQDAWPHDIILDKQGNWIKGWVVKRGDQSFPCAVLCDRQALKYARKRIPEDLAKNHYTARFIDTTTASPWRECYSPDHPMTRSDSRQYKMELLKYVSEEAKLVTGTETGIDPSVPFVHYYEGMLSLGPYRVPDSGRDMIRAWEPTENILKFQVGHYYRAPLWELVYHDCTVAMWYWGDYNNKVPAVWDRRDLFNVLYGTPPMFMFNKDIWEKNRDRFVQSYKAICPAVAKIADQEMTNHEFLTDDHTVQRTTFADGTQVIANFGDKAFKQDGVEVGPMSVSVAKGK